MVVNGEDPTAHPDPIHARNARLVGDRLSFPGGEGTPGVREFTLGEIAMARECTDGTTRWAIGDVLDLQHRLPRIWIRVKAGDCEPWVAKKVARMSRHLPADRVGVVDTAVARIIDREAPHRVLTVAEAAIISADTELHETRRQGRLRGRHLDITRRKDDGTGDSEPLDGVAILRGRIDAGDALWLEAMINRLADIIAPDHPQARRDELRAIATGLLADPARVLHLLALHARAAENPEPVVEAPEPDPQVDPQPTLFGDPAALADTLATLASLSGADLCRLHPRATLYVHLHEAALLGAAGGCARVEGIGPMSLAALGDLLGRTDVVVKPVIDLNGQVRSTSYEHPEALKERVFLGTGGEYWPHATYGPWADGSPCLATGTSTNRRTCENDHVTSFRHPPPGEPPDPNDRGQTGTHNSGPLTHRHHRWKTVAGYRARQAGPGRYALLSPHGLGFIVDATGTRPMDAEKVRLIIDAEGEIDIYPAG